MESAPTSYSRMTNHESRLLVHRPPVYPSTHPPIHPSSYSQITNHELRIPNQLVGYGIGGRIWNPPLRAIHESPFLVYWLLVHYSSLFLFTNHESRFTVIGASSTHPPVYPSTHPPIYPSSYSQITNYESRINWADIECACTLFLFTVH